MMLPVRNLLPFLDIVMDKKNPSLDGLCLCL